MFQFIDPDMFHEKEIPKIWNAGETEVYVIHFVSIFRENVQQLFVVKVTVAKYVCQIIDLVIPL